MSEQQKPATDKPAEDFAKAASEQKSGLMGELWSLVRQSGKWWLIPIIVVLLIIGLIVFLGSTAAAPFIYQLF